MTKHAMFPLALAAVLLAAGARPAAARADWTLGASLERSHDDNVLQLTSRRLDQLTATPGMPRFRIDTPDDDVSTLALSGAWQSHLVRRRQTRFAAAFEAHQYARNDVCNWNELSGSVRQELTASRRMLTTLTLSGESLPKYYLGEVTDPDESFAAGRRIRQSLQYAQRTLGARLDQRLLRGRVSWSAGFDRQHRDYGPHFAERDNDDDAWTLEARVQPLRAWGATAGVTWITGRLAARGELADTPVRDTDISYDHDGIGVSASLPWGHGRTRGRFDAEWQPEDRTYRTADKFDVLRYGRVNHRRFVELRATQRVWGPIEAVAHWSRLTSDAAFPPGIAIPEEQTDFTQTRAGLALRGRWSLSGS